MEALKIAAPNPLEALQEFGPLFRDRSITHDREGSFVFDNYEDLKSIGVFAGLVPRELGGLGMKHEEMGRFIRTLAHYSSSTALAFSMHQHLIAAAVWKFIHQGKSEPLLRRVANEQILLISTGAKDWLGSSGLAVKTEGGYLVSGKKPFASQSVAGDIAVTSAPYLNEKKEWKVLHFAVPMNAPGVSLLDDWDTLGMRGTGSQSIVFDKVFIPDSAIDLERDRNKFHPVWNLVLTVAMPLIMSAYVGIAERAWEIALEKAKGNNDRENFETITIGKLYNSFLSAETQWKAMFSHANNFDFAINQDHTTDILSLKTNVAEACRQTVAAAMECTGGQSYYKRSELERLFRDVQAAQFHPLPQWEQYEFTGKKLLGI